MSVNQIPQVPIAVAENTSASPLLSLVDGGAETEIGTVVREVFYGTRENVGFVLEVYRQAFLLPFSHAHAIRRAISVYKDWIQMNVGCIIEGIAVKAKRSLRETNVNVFVFQPQVPESPPFILEPMEGFDATDPESRVRLRNDSYIGAVHKDHLLVRAGLQVGRGETSGRERGRWELLVD